MKRFHLSEDLSLPVDAVSETFALLAVRGAGKTNAARVMAEEMFAAGAPFVAVDPVGSWWGLRAGRDGKPGGIPIPILGGERGDVPLERTGGALVADLIVDQNVSCVLDLSAFESEAAKRQFLLDFARRLYARNRTPRHLFLEECDDYLPQRPGRDQLALLGAFEAIVRRGRSRGLGITLITQRSAVVNKNVLTQIGTLITLRTTSPQDRAAVEAWVEHNDQKGDILESLPGLKSGEAWVWSPHFLGATCKIRFRLSETFDSGATPKLGSAGAKVAAAATLADVDLGDLQKRMAATIEKAKASDPKALQAEVARLKREIAAKPVPVSVAPKAERVEVPVLREGHLARIEKLADRLTVSVISAYDKLSAAAAELHHAINKVARTRAPSSANGLPALGRPEAGRAPTPNPNGLHRRGSSQVATSAHGDEPLTGPEQRILDAIAWLEATNGSPQQDQAAVAFVAGYTVGGGAFNNPRGRLNSRGLVEYRGGDLILTEAGRSVANAPDVPLTSAELHERVLERLPGPEQKLLRVLLDAYPRDIENDELARRAGYEPGGGAFNNPRGRLRSLGLAAYPRKGFVAAAPVLFLEGQS